MADVHSGSSDASFSPGRGVDRFLNLGIVAAVLFSLLSWGWYFWRSSGQPGPQNEAYDVGDAFPPDVGLRLEAADRSVVLFVLSTCPVCTDMMPFYRQLVEHRQSGRPPYPVHVISHEPERQLQNYLSRHDVYPDSARSVTRAAFAGRYTPRLYLVSAKGRIEAVWKGRLSAADQAQVLAAISSHVSPDVAEPAAAGNG